GVVRGTVEHITGNKSPGYTGSSVILGVEDFFTDASGEATLTLEPCVGDLAGTIYVVSIAGRVERIQPVADGAWNLGDPAIKAPGGAPSVSWVPGPPGGTGLVGELAERPTASEAGDGTLFTATDENDGTLAVAT